MNNKTIDLIEAPLFEGSSSIGAHLAYKFLKKEQSFGNGVVFCDYEQIVTVDPLCSSALITNLGIVMTKCENVRLAVLKSLSEKHFPIVIGGDHSVAMSSIAAGSETVGIDDYAIIYIDGHADINTEITSHSHNIHGMPLASSLGLCSDSLRVGPLKKKIKGENLFILGARSVDPPEYSIIKENGVHFFESNVFLNENFDNVLEKIKNIIGEKKVHISFDVDVLDPKAFSSTGYIMENGLSLNNVIQIIDYSLTNFDVISMDVVEYNPTLDKEKKDLNTLIGILKNIIKHTYLNS